MSFTLILSLFLSIGYTQIIPVRNANGNTYDYIDSVTKKIISRNTYDQASPFSEGMARVNRNGLFGFINTKGEEVISCKYIHAKDFSEGFAPVSIGTQVINENYISVKDEKYGIIDKTGQKVISFEFEDIELFKNGIARARELATRKWGWIDDKGKWDISPRFYDAEDFNNLGMAMIALDYDANGYIDRQGNYVIKPEYYSIGDFIDGIAPAREWGSENKFNGKCGFINIKGETIIPFIYEHAMPFIDGMAKVSKEGKWGYIDKSGRVQIPIKYDYISDFINGHVWVNENGFWGTLNNKGQFVIPANFDFIVEGIATDRILVDKDGLWGMYDYSGNEIIPIKFEQITSNDSVVFYGTIGNLHYLYDIRGNLLSKNNDPNWPDSYNESVQSKEIEQIYNMYKRPNAGGYKIDSAFQFYKVVKKDKNYGVENYQ